MECNTLNCRRHPNQASPTALTAAAATASTASTAATATTATAANDISGGVMNCLATSIAH